MKKNYGTDAFAKDDQNTDAFTKNDQKTNSLMKDDHGAEAGGRNGEDTAGNEFRASGVTAGYAKKPLMKEIDLTLRRGEIITLIGPNGSGKSTLLKTMTGWLDTLGGSIYVDGRNLTDLKGGDIGKHLSVLLTEKIRPELMTCFDVVCTGRYPYTGRFGILSDADRQKAFEAMKMVRLTDLTERDFSQTSDGQKQRVMLARAICQDTPYLLLDEPTSFLDINYKLELMDILRTLARNGKGIMMSLHELELAGMVSDRLVCVRTDGRGVSEEGAADEKLSSWIDRIGTPDEIYTGDYLDELYGMKKGTYRKYLRDSRVFRGMVEG